MTRMNKPLESKDPRLSKKTVVLQGCKVQIYRSIEEMLLNDHRDRLCPLRLPRTDCLLEGRRIWPIFSAKTPASSSQSGARLKLDHAWSQQRINADQKVQQLNHILKSELFVLLESQAELKIAH